MSIFLSNSIFFLSIWSSDQINYFIDKSLLWSKILQGVSYLYTVCICRWLVISHMIPVRTFYLKKFLVYPRFSKLKTCIRFQAIISKQVYRRLRIIEKSSISFLPLNTNVKLKALYPNPQCQSPQSQLKSQ